MNKLLIASLLAIASVGCAGVDRAEEPFVWLVVENRFHLDANIYAGAPNLRRVMSVPAYSGKNQVQVTAHQPGLEIAIDFLRSRRTWRTVVEWAKAGDCVWLTVTPMLALTNAVPCFEET